VPSWVAMPVGCQPGCQSHRVRAVRLPGPGSYPPAAPRLSSGRTGPWWPGVDGRRGSAPRGSACRPRDGWIRRSAEGRGVGLGAALRLIVRLAELP